MFISGGICLFLLRIIHQQQIAYILSLAVLFSLLIFIPRLLSSTDTEISLTNNGIEQKWVRQFQFHHRPTIFIHWQDIADYVFEPHRQFDQFKLHLKDGTVFRLFHNHDHDKDEFKSFIHDFIQQVKQLNAQTRNQYIAIQEGKSTYTWQTWALGSCAVFITILISTLVFTHPPKTQLPLYKWGLLFGGYLLGMFVLISSIRKLKNAQP